MEIGREREGKDWGGKVTHSVHTLVWMYPTYLFSAFFFIAAKGLLKYLKKKITQ